MTSDLDALITHTGQTALHVRTDGGVARSHFGGHPRVPAGWQWPTHDEQPLAFLGALDMSEVHAAMAVDWLPERGQVLFFYDTESQPWGFDPSERQGWTVQFVPAGVDTVEATAPGKSYARRAMRFTPIQTYFAEDLPTDADLDDDQQDALREHISKRNFGDRPHHQLGGFADPVQNAGMPVQCELASNGVYVGNADGYNSAKGQALLNGGGEHDWRLLLQVDTDDTQEGAEWMWGDAGMLYFWVRAQEARLGDFSNAWLVLQCC